MELKTRLKIHCNVMEDMIMSHLCNSLYNYAINVLKLTHEEALSLANSNDINIKSYYFYQTEINEQLIVPSKYEEYKHKLIGLIYTLNAEDVYNKIRLIVD